MDSHLVSHDTVHSYSTRFSQRGGFGLPKVKGYGSKSFSFKGAKLWNTLPTNISDIDKLHFCDSSCDIKLPLYVMPPMPRTTMEIRVCLFFVLYLVFGKPVMVLNLNLIEILYMLCFNK